VKIHSSLAAVAVLLVATTVLPACAPLVIGGAAVGSALFAVDRRTSGAQLEDTTIEVKAMSQASGLSPQGHVSATSYNRIVLLTGEVGTEAERAAVEQAVAKLDNVRSVVNELALMAASSFTARSNDAILSAKVKGAFIDARDMQANTLKVISERGIVYLMGIVTEREAARAADVARGVGGVQKVVRVFEVITEEELARVQPKPAPK
jgi:osmotically-inducible protein OsmY